MLSDPQLTSSSFTNLDSAVGGDLSPLLPNNPNDTVNQTKTKICAYIIIIVVFLLMVALELVASFGPIFLLFHSMFTDSSSVTQKMVTTPKLSTNVCPHREIRLVADILYSFDCSNITDDVTGTYNGIEAVPSEMSIDDIRLRYPLPLYVRPDYSGQGVALELNSSKKYTYIELVRSPIFFNTTFTITVWLSPIVQHSTVYCLLRQMYRSAPDLGFSIIDEHVVMRAYGAVLWSNRKLKNFQWQHVTLTFSQQDMLMSIYIDGILDATGFIEHPKYGNFEIQRTTLGSCESLYPYNGLMDQLTILFRLKNRTEILDEATLILHYNFEDRGTASDLFKDISVNDIRTQQSHVSSFNDSRRLGHSSLSLYDPTLSFFQTGGFALPLTYNYSYSYALWLHVSNVPSFIPFIHLMAKSEFPLFKNNSEKCLAVLTMNKTGISRLFELDIKVLYFSSISDNNHFQLSVYIYRSSKPIIITSTTLISYSNWFHVVVISGTHSASLYVNGTFVGSSIVTESNVSILSNRDRLTLTIGNPARDITDSTLHLSTCSIGTSGTTFSESVIDIDELRFYSRELEVKEIEALKNDDHNPTRFFFE